jgi:hypothetical protein
MSAPNPDDGPTRVQHIRQLISHYDPSAPALLRLIARYEELDAEITRFSDTNRDSRLQDYHTFELVEVGANRPRSAEYRRARVWTRIPRNQLEAVAGVLELLGLELEGEMEA